jgi:hypothetical protein
VRVSDSIPNLEEDSDSRITALKRKNNPLQNYLHTWELPPEYLKALPLN